MTAFTFELRILILVAVPIIFSQFFYHVIYFYMRILSLSFYFHSWREVWRLSPQGGSRSLQWSETGMEDPKRTPWQCTASVCSGSALLGDLLGVSRSRECDLLSLLTIYSRILLCIFIVYRRIVRILCLLLYSAIYWCVGCFGLVVSTCQVVGWKDPSEDTLTWCGDYLHKAQVEESVCVYFAFV